MEIVLTVFEKLEYFIERSGERKGHDCMSRRKFFQTPKNFILKRPACLFTVHNTDWRVFSSFFSIDAYLIHLCFFGCFKVYFSVSGHFVLCNFNLCNFNRCQFNRSQFQPLAISTVHTFNLLQFQPTAISTYHISA